MPTYIAREREEGGTKVAFETGIESPVNTILERS